MTCATSPRAAAMRCSVGSRWRSGLRGRARRRGGWSSCSSKSSPAACAPDRRLVCKDYFIESTEWVLEQVTNRLAELSDEELLDLRHVASLLRLPADMDLDSSLQPRGYRLLSKIPRLPEAIAENVVQRFGQLPKIMRASISDLVEVEGVGEARARAIKEGLSRLAETSILDRYA